MRFARSLVLALSLMSVNAVAQPEIFFGNGDAPIFRETEMDRRFTKTRLYQALGKGTNDANCAQLIGAMLTMLGETAPLLHKRDENFYLDPVLVQALTTQLTNQRFPGNSFFVAMVRRVLIDGKLSKEWLLTADALAPYYPGIDMTRLRFLADGVDPLDSFLLTLLAVRERYVEEVQRVNSVAASTAEALFRENYLDHVVSFGNLELVDIKLQTPKKKRLKKGEEPEKPYMLATMNWFQPKTPEEQRQVEIHFGRPKKVIPVVVSAKLKDKQYTDLNKLLKGSRVMVRGRFWDYKKGMNTLDLREGLIFQERDWSQTPVLADPNAVMACPLSINDLTGIASNQPGAFGSFR